MKFADDGKTLKPKFCNSLDRKFLFVFIFFILSLYHSSFSSAEVAAIEAILSTG